MRPSKSRMDKYASATVANGATGTVLSFRWRSEPGVLTLLGFGCGTVTDWAGVTFALKVNGLPVNDYAKVQDEIGSMKFPTAVEVEIPADALVEVTAANGNAASGLFGARVVIVGR